MKETVSKAISNGDSTNPIQASVVVTTDPTKNGLVIVNADGSSIGSNFIRKDGSNSNIDTLTFDDTPASVDALNPGELRWNSTDGTMDLGMPFGVTQQIGQELFIKCINKTGSTLTNGSAVYFSGRQGNRPKVLLARSDSESTSAVAGILTQDILNNEEGFVTVLGYVRQIKTDYSGTGNWGTTRIEGDNLYVSKTVAGQLTNIEPSVPHHSDIVGSVAIVGGGGIGSILVNIQRHKTLEELSDIDGTPVIRTGQTVMYDAEGGYYDFNANIADYNSSSPFLRVGLYRNYLLQTEDFSNASWVKVNLSGTVTSNSATDPYSGTTAEIIPAGNSATGEVNQAITDSSTGAWTFSVWLKCNAGTGTVQIEIDSSAEMGTTKTVNLTTAWKRYYVTQNFVSANTTKTVRITNGTLAISSWGAMLDNVGFVRRYGAPQTTTAVTTDTTILYTPNALTTLGAITSGAGLSGTTIASSGTNTNTQTDVGARETIEGYVATNTTASTAIAPVQNSTTNRRSGTAWDTASRTTNRRNQLVNRADTTIVSRRKRAYDKAGAGYDELMNIMSNGVINALGTTLGAENLTNGALTSGTSRAVTGDMVLTGNTLVYTHSTGAGTITQTSANLGVQLKPYRWYKLVLTTSALSGTAPTIWIDTVCSTSKVHLHTATNGTYTIYFQTPATVTDFKLSGSSSGTGAVTIDTLSLKEITNGDFSAMGMFTGGNPSTGVKVNNDSIDFIIQ